MSPCLRVAEGFSGQHAGRRRSCPRPKVWVELSESFEIVGDAPGIARSFATTYRATTSDGGFNREVAHGLLRSRKPQYACALPPALIDDDPLAGVAEWQTLRT